LTFRAPEGLKEAGEDIKGNPYKNAGVTLLHFNQGKISFISDFFKDTSFVKVPSK
jgi:hypothetical protein